MVDKDDNTKSTFLATDDWLAEEVNIDELEIMSMIEAVTLFDEPICWETNAQHIKNIFSWSTTNLFQNEKVNRKEQDDQHIPELSPQIAVASCSLCLASLLEFFGILENELFLLPWNIIICHLIRDQSIGRATKKKDICWQTWERNVCRLT